MPTATRAVASKLYSLEGFLVFTWVYLGLRVRALLGATGNGRAQKLAYLGLVNQSGVELSSRGWVPGRGFHSGRRGECLLTGPRIGDAAHLEQGGPLMKFHQPMAARGCESVFFSKRRDCSHDPLLLTLRGHRISPGAVVSLLLAADRGARADIIISFL